MDNSWLAIPGTDNFTLRKAFGKFATGVTVVATRLEDGQTRAFTANSFTSVSLDPALVLVCLLKSSGSYEEFKRASSYSISILADNHRDLSSAFASRDSEVKADASTKLSDELVPHVSDCLAAFECTPYQMIDAGDHLIMLGRVVRFRTAEGAPLGFFSGKYVNIENVLNTFA